MTGPGPESEWVPPSGGRPLVGQPIADIRATATENGWAEDPPLTFITERFSRAIRFTVDADDVVTAAEFVSSPEAVGGVPPGVPELTDEQVDAELSLAIIGYEPTEIYPEWSNARMRDAYRAGREDALADLREARTIITVEQLDALPEGSIIRWNRVPGATQAIERGMHDWYEPGNESSEPHGPHLLPALLLWHPDWSDQ